jgi:DNA-binding PadR family transcriptional regulator
MTTSSRLRRPAELRRSLPEITEGSGIVDHGQISKLLTRLAALSLIENLVDGQRKGAANAWHLTARGAQIERAARPR